MARTPCLSPRTVNGNCQKIDGSCPSQTGLWLTGTENARACLGTLRCRPEPKRCLDTRSVSLETSRGCTVAPSVPWVEHLGQSQEVSMPTGADRSSQFAPAPCVVQPRGGSPWMASLSSQCCPSVFDAAPEHPGSPRASRWRCDDHCRRCERSPTSGLAQTADAAGELQAAIAGLATARGSERQAAGFGQRSWAPRGSGSRSAARIRTPSRGPPRAHSALERPRLVVLVATRKPPSAAVAAPLAHAVRRGGRHY